MRSRPKPTYRFLWVSVHVARVPTHILSTHTRIRHNLQLFLLRIITKGFVSTAMLFKYVRSKKTINSFSTCWYILIERRTKENDSCYWTPSLFKSLGYNSTFIVENWCCIYFFGRGTREYSGVFETSCFFLSRDSFT